MCINQSIKIGVLLATLSGVAAVQAEEKSSLRYESDFESLKNYQAPEWFQDAKFGIWPIWGVYSVPAFRGTHAAEWYSRHMYDVKNTNGHFEYHKKTYGDQHDFGFKDLIPLFKAEKWDPDEWLQLAEDSGARYFTVLAEFCDAFAMYDSSHTKWNAAKMGPKRDIVGELATATRKRGMKFGISNHLACNYFFYSHNHDNGFDAVDPDTHDLYTDGSGASPWFLDRWWKRTTELVDKYQPDLYYFDWGWNKDPAFVDVRRDFFAYYYNKAIDWGVGTYGEPNVVINYKGWRKTSEHIIGVPDQERGGAKKISPFAAQLDDAISIASWSYSTIDTYKTPNFLIDAFVDMVSKNYNLLLAFGPKADGTVPEEYRSRLLAMGEWLKVNGEAIYATRPYTVFGEGPTGSIKVEHHRDMITGTAEDIRFTRNKDNAILYAIVLDWPGEELVIESFKKGSFDVSGLESINMLGGSGILKWSQDEAGLKIKLPEKAGCDHAHAFRLTFEGSVPELK
jgi:alpha-L-fucosidase